MSNRNFVQSASRNTSGSSISRRLAVAALLPAIALAGCVAVPVGSTPEGVPYYAYYPVGAPVVPAPGAVPPSVRMAFPTATLVKSIFN